MKMASASTPQTYPIPPHPRKPPRAAFFRGASMSQIGLVPFYRAVDTNGNPLANARLYTFLTGTTTPQAVYTTDALNVSHGPYVQADANGLFPAFYPDPALTYRYQLRVSPYS